MSDLPIQDLSDRAKRALSAALDGRPVTREEIGKLVARDIWIMPGYGRATSNEIAKWAKRLGIDMPDYRSFGAEKL